MEDAIRTGGCLCGDVRYCVRGEPVHVGRCHCADCRKESGSAFTIYGQWPIDAFESTGEIASYHGRGFCPRCGSRLLDPPGPGAVRPQAGGRGLGEAPGAVACIGRRRLTARRESLAPRDELVEELDVDVDAARLLRGDSIRLHTRGR